MFGNSSIEGVLKLSRIGKQPIKIPEGVNVQVDDSIIKVTKGEKTLQQEIHPDIKIEIDQESGLH